MKTTVQVISYTIIGVLLLRELWKLYRLGYHRGKKEGFQEGLKAGLETGRAYEHFFRNWTPGALSSFQPNELLPRSHKKEKLS